MKLNIGRTTSISLPLSTSVPVHGAQFLNTTFLLLLFPALPAAAVFVTDIIHLTNKYASL